MVVVFGWVWVFVVVGWFCLGGGGLGGGAAPPEWVPGFVCRRVVSPDEVVPLEPVPFGVTSPRLCALTVVYVVTVGGGGSGPGYSPVSPVNGGSPSFGGLTLVKVGCKVCSYREVAVKRDLILAGFRRASGRSMKSLAEEAEPSPWDRLATVEGNIVDLTKRVAELERQDAETADEFRFHANLFLSVDSYILGLLERMDKMEERVAELGRDPMEEDALTRGAFKIGGTDCD